MELTWLACDLKSGAIRGELPLAVDRVRSLLNREEQASWVLPTADPACPPDWPAQVVAGRDMIVVLADGIPLEAWAITSLRVGTSGVTIGGTTLVTCLARTNVPTLDLEVAEQFGLAWLCTPLIENFGFELWFALVDGGAVDEFYYDTEDDLSILAALNQRASAQGSIGWRIYLALEDGVVTKTLTIVQDAAVHDPFTPQRPAPRPDAVFDLDVDGHGNVVSYERLTDYGPARGATKLIGVSNGGGSSRPMTDPIISPYVGMGWPIWEARPSFDGLDADTIDDPDAELNRLAQAAAVQRERGLVTWEITGDASSPRPGIDFNPGDTVFVRIAPQGKGDPVGGSAAIRVLGWELDTRSGDLTVIAWEVPA